MKIKEKYREDVIHPALTGRLAKELYQRNFKADFWFSSPHRTNKECSNPVFMDTHLHRIALMKNRYISKEDKNGAPGWITKGVCTGCGKVFKKYTYFVIGVDKTMEKITI